MNSDSKLIFEAYTDGRDKLVVPDPGKTEVPVPAAPVPPAAPAPNSEKSEELKLAAQARDLLYSIKQHANRCAGLYDDTTPSQISKKRIGMFVVILAQLEKLLQRLE